MARRTYNIENRCPHGWSQGLWLTIKDVLNLVRIETANPVIVLDWDLRGVTFTVDGTEYYIRTWNIHPDKPHRRNIVEWTLFRHNPDLHSDRITGGTFVFSYRRLIAEGKRLEELYRDEENGKTES